MTPGNPPLIRQSHRRLPAASRAAPTLGMDMTLWTEIARTTTTSGDDISLRRRDETYEIRFNGMELMSSINHQSETVLAERSARLFGVAARRVLIGGLGMGYTLRTALDWLEPDAQVTVCELVPEIVDWNRRFIGHLAGHPLCDPRVDVRVEDVQQVLRRQRAAYDIILMDTDNGPDFTIRDTNGGIYSDSGLNSVWRSLKPGGIAAFWSATISDAFEERLDRLPWQWRRYDICLVGGRADAFHYIYFAGATLEDPRPQLAAPREQTQRVLEGVM